MKVVLSRLPSVLATGALVACASPSPSSAPASASAPGVAPSSQEAASPDATAEPSGSADEPTSGDPPPIALEEVASGFADPIGITFTPDGWMLVNERGGRVMAVDPSTGATEVALDISDRVLGEGERGLLGLALHPDWPQDSRAYVHYSAREGDGDTVLSEFRVTDEPLPPRLDVTTERLLLTHDQPYPNHNGGQLAFGPDGYLYMGLGDGGSGGDPHGNGQNPDTLLGKILRIDVESDDGFGIPPDNPFADAGGAPEVFLIGLRNPWRFSFDRESGHLWIGDVGQNLAEEIDRVDPAADAGANLGWNAMEASHCFVEPNCATDGLVLPVVEYGHDLGCSVTGGYVYRGEAIGGLRGWYLFSDYCSGIIFGVPSDAEGVIGPRTVLDTDLAVSSFGEGPGGELYLAAISGGSIYRIVAGD